MPVAEEAQKVHRILQTLAHAKYDIIGHSKGGIVAHYLNDMIVTDYRLRKIISVTSPHLGSRLTTFLGGQVESDLGVNCSR